MADAVPAARLDTLADDLRGSLVRPGDPGYDEARSVWNGMIDRRPAAVARCTGVADVIACVDAAREADVPLAVRGGGHSVAGHGTVDDGLVADLSDLDQVRVDPEARRASVGPGATLGDVDHETQAFGLAVPSGVVSMTGMAGLALGGGVGWLMREHGLTCDRLVAADVVTASGELVHASEEENPELLWGLRGGGGNFGVVTRLEFDLVEVGPTVLGGANLYPADQAREVLEAYRSFTRDAPEELVTACAVKTAPEEGVPEEHAGEPVVALDLCWCGDLEAGRKAVAPLEKVGDPIREGVGPVEFTDLQSKSDDAWEAGARDYWKSCYLPDLPDGVLEAMLDRVREMPSSIMDYKLEHAGGAMGRPDESAAAFSGRWAEYIFKINCRWEDPVADEANVAWTRDLFRDVASHAPEGVYVNYLAGDDADRIEAAYGEETYQRLVDLKRTWDPGNLFRVNQNIEP